MRRNPNGDGYSHSHFNPRTPYGMRRWLTDIKKAKFIISIHAPLTGCDFEPLLISF